VVESRHSKIRRPWGKRFVGEAVPVRADEWKPVRPAATNPSLRFITAAAPTFHPDHLMLNQYLECCAFSGSGRVADCLL
jgi:hypothetical protein